MSPDGLLDPLPVPEALRVATSDRAVARAMLDFEAALAGVEAEHGLIDQDAATTIAAACDVDALDLEAIAAAAADAGNPAAPLVAALRERAGEAGADVHRGATSQDALDTALALVSRDAGRLVLAELDRVRAACAALADRHRSTTMAGRTLLQHAVPTAFGLRAAGWLVGACEARQLLAEAVDDLALQLGGAAGTLAGLGDDGTGVAASVAERLGLVAPAIPWHANRVRPAALAAALAICAGAVSKIALDVILLSQTEVAEVAEPRTAGRGGSSTMPQKRNPVGSVLVRGAAARVTGLAGTVIGSLEQELERAAGGWQAEWAPLREALALTGGIAATMADVLEGLEVDAARMRANLALGGGALLAERVAFALSDPLGRERARELVAAAAADERGLGDALRERPEVVEAAGGSEALERLLDPDGYLGSADELIDRALAMHGGDGT